MASRSRACSMKGAGARCGDRGRTGLWRCLRGCPGQPFARPSQAPGLAAPDLPGEGLLPHLADHRSGWGARIHRDGRNPQGGGDAPGRPHPGGGTAELAGFSLALRPARRRTLAHVVRDLFGAGGDLEGACFWTGLRPMTPTAPPSSARRPTPTCIWPPATARWDGRWRPGPGGPGGPGLSNGGPISTWRGSLARYRA
jgi:hypothetical protein